jgi:lipopolysaccharide export system permease protein
MTILDRHIGRAIAFSTLLVLGVLLSLFTFITFVEAIGDLGKANFGLAEVLKYVLLSLPRDAYELFPMTALLGATLGLSSLAVGSELIVMRAAGVSLLRIVGSVMKVGAVLILIAVVVGEVVAPVTEDLAQRGRAAALQRSVAQQSDRGLWLRDGSAFVHVGEVLPDLSLLRVTIYQFDDNARLRSQTFAQSGRYEQQRWRLDDVRQSWIADDKVHSRRLASDYLSSVLTPEILGVFAVKPEGLSAWHLFRYIQHLERSKQDTSRYRLALWHKIMLPLSTGVMVVLAIPFVFGQLRSGGLGSRVLVGIVLGLAFYLINRAFGYFGLLHGLPPAFGALLPPTLFFALALVMLRRVA